jgi:Flp pilus assembly protein TadB
MSGPITAAYFFVHGALLLSARALREARAMKREFGEMRDQLRVREDELARARRGQQEARLDRIGAIRRRAQRQEAIFMRPQRLALALVLLVAALALWAPWLLLALILAAASALGYRWHLASKANRGVLDA